MGCNEFESGDNRPPRVAERGTPSQADEVKVVTIGLTAKGR